MIMKMEDLEENQFIVLVGSARGIYSLYTIGLPEAAEKFILY